MSRTKVCPSYALSLYSPARSLPADVLRAMQDLIGGGQASPSTPCYAGRHFRTHCTALGCTADLHFERRYCQRKKLCHAHMQVCLALVVPPAHSMAGLYPHSGSFAFCVWVRAAAHRAPKDSKTSTECEAERYPWLLRLRHWVCLCCAPASG